MTSAVVEGEPWSHRRWWWVVALVFGVQAAVILLLGERGPVKPRPPAPVQTLRFLQNVSSEWLALNDPTLFALPHRQGFSAGAWMTIPSVGDHPFEWVEEPDWLRLAAAGLGVMGSGLQETNLSPGIRIPPMPAPDLPVPELLPATPLAEHSRLRFEGPLADRRLLTPFQLPDPAFSDILTNSKVQMVVNAQGRPVSATLLSPSGLPAADESALAFARTARFEPLAGAETDRVPSDSTITRLTWGILVIDWRTLPPPPTAAPPSK